MLESDPPPAYTPRRPRDLALPGRRHFPAWLADDGFAGTKPLAETWYQRVVERTHADPRVVYEAAEPRLLSPGALCSKRVYFLEFGWCGGTMQRGALVRAWRALLAAHDVLSRARCDVCAIVDELEPPPAAAQSVATDTTLAPTPAEKTPLSDLRKRKAALFVHPFHGLAAVISALEGAIMMMDQDLCALGALERAGALPAHWAPSPAVRDVLTSRRGAGVGGGEVSEHIFRLAAAADGVGAHPRILAAVEAARAFAEDIAPGRWEAMQGRSHV